MNHSRIIKFQKTFLFILSFGCLSSSFGQEIPSLLSDRPGFAYGASLLAPQTMQLELSYHLLYESYEYPFVGVKNTDLDRSTQLEFRKRGNKKWEIAAGFSFNRRHRSSLEIQDNSGSYTVTYEDKVNRINNLYLKFRLPLLKGHAYLPAVTFITDLGVIPYSSEVNVTNTSHLVLEKAVHKRWTITGNINFLTHVGGGDVFLKGVSSPLILNVDFAAHPKLHVYAERIWKDLSSFHNSENFGVVYRINNAFQLDLSMETWMTNGMLFHRNFAFGLVYRPSQKQ